MDIMIFANELCCFVPSWWLQPLQPIDIVSIFIFFSPFSMIVVAADVYLYYLLYAMWYIQWNSIIFPTLLPHPSLSYPGKKHPKINHFAISTQLDLTLSECIVLMRLNHINLPQSALNLLHISESLWVSLYLAILIYRLSAIQYIITNEIIVC